MKYLPNITLTNSKIELKVTNMNNGFKTKGKENYKITVFDGGSSQNPQNLIFNYNILPPSFKLYFITNELDDPVFKMRPT